MTDVDTSKRDQWVESRKERGRDEPPSEPPLNGGGGGGTYDDMLVRVAVLEANVAHIKTEIDRLAATPADLATLKERTSYLPTKSDVKTEIVAAVDRSAVKMQRTVAIVGGMVTIAVAAINYLPQLLNLG